MMGNKPKGTPKIKIEDLSCLTSKLNITDDTLNKGQYRFNWLKSRKVQSLEVI